MADVFISYAREDQAVAAKLRALLELEGWEVWWDQQIHAGARWSNEIDRAIRAAKAVVVLWTAHSAGSDWVSREAAIAREQGKLIPVQLDAGLPPFDDVEAARLVGWQGEEDHRELPVLFEGLGRLARPTRIDTVRPGYEIDFLGVPIDLPSIPGVGDEYRYLHFSVVMNPARRLAWYVAYNVEKQEHRPEREYVWIPDPTLSPSFQPANEHFRGTQFERGHIVSPPSVAWGPERAAGIAMRQAYFWTNTAPQTRTLNQKTWSSLEHFERRRAADHRRVTGFSGPVLDPGDPPHVVTDERRGRVHARQTFHLPCTFWKVAVYRTRHRLVTRCWTVPNTDGRESRSTLARIEELTGLRFPANLTSSRAGV